MPRKVRPIKKTSRNAWRKFSKYGNKKVFDPFHGNFDSQLEHDVYLYLLRLQEQGEIHDLKRQVEIEVIPKSLFFKFKQLKTKFRYNAHHLRSMKYIADYTYYDKEGGYHVCDAKGRKTKEYVIKKKILLALKGIYIEEWSEPKADSYNYQVDMGFVDIDLNKKYWMPSSAKIKKV